MRILHVVATLDPRTGGLAACVSKVGSAMSLRGHDVTVAASADTASRPWVSTFPVKCECLGPGLLQYGLSARLPIWLWRYARFFDVLIINGLWQFQGVVTALVARLLGRPYIVYVHGMLGPLGKQGSWKFLKKLVYWSLIEYWVVRGARLTVFTSEEEAELAKSFFPFHQWTEAVIPNGVEPPPSVGDEHLESVCRRFPQLAGKKMVMFLGRLHPGKGCDILLEAFARQFRHLSAYHLVIVGPQASARYQAQLLSLTSQLGLADQVTWTGMLLGQDKEAVFRMASVFVAPSHHENFGMAIVEAIARRVPVITTRKVNIHSLLSSAGAALICDDTVDSLSRALHEWSAMSAKDLLAMRDSQAHAFDALFSVDKTAETLEANLLRFRAP